MIKPISREPVWIKRDEWGDTAFQIMPLDAEQQAIANGYLPEPDADFNDPDVRSRAMIYDLKLLEFSLVNWRKFGKPAMKFDRDDSMLDKISMIPREVRGILVKEIWDISFLTEDERKNSDSLESGSTGKKQDSK